MKRFNHILASLLLVLAAAFTGCINEDDIVSLDAQEGGLVTNGGNVNYVVGENKPVAYTLFIPSGPAIKEVKIYKSYYNVKDKKTSNEVLLSTVPVTGAQIKGSMTFADLVKGLQYNGAALPSQDTKYNVGDYWVFRIVSSFVNGATDVQSSSSFRVAISTRLAGKYKASGVFVHPVGGPRNFTDLDKEISSVDAATYQCDQTGDLGDYPWQFTVNADNTINIIAGEVGGNKIKVVSSKVTLKDNGADVIEVKYQYNDAAPRVITETLVKQVK